MSLIRAATTVGGFTLISRFAGFARDLLMARFLGAGFAADAFLVAFRLPNLFRSLFAEGAFAAAFVPMVSAKLGKRDGSVGDIRPAMDFTEQALAFLVPILLGFSTLFMLAAAPIVWLMTGGFEDGDPAKIAFTTDLTRLTFPYLLLISITALLGGLMNAVGRFWVNAAAPILLNAVMVGALLFFRGDSSEDTARALALAVSLAGIAQLLWLAWGCHAAGLLPRLRWPRMTGEVRTLLRRIGPAALGAGATQVNLLVSTMIAARLLPQGSVSYLYYADRLNQLPLGMIGIGMGVALLPTMSRLLGAGNPDAAIHQQNRAIEFVLLLSLPAAFAFVAAAEPIIAALFQSGEFGRADTAGAYTALQAFALGLPAYVLIKVLTPGFHARGDTRTPMRIALLAIGANLVGNLTLIWWFGHVGIALATALAAWLNVVLLWAALHRRGDYRADAGVRRTVPRMLMAGALMAALLALASPMLMPWAESGSVQRLLSLAMLVGGGVAIYFGAGFLLGAYSPRQLVQAFRRGTA
jgi:putative peptidoglycan lipid II flippase